MKDRAIPVAPVTNKVTRKEELANSAHRKARAEEVQNVRSSTMTKVVESEKETPDSGRQAQQIGSPLRVQKSATGQGQACQENKVAVQRQELRLLASSILHFHKRGKCRSGTTISAKMIVHRVPHVGTQQTKKQDSNMIAKSKAGGNSLQVLSNGDWTQQVSPLASLLCEGRLIAGAA